MDDNNNKSGSKVVFKILVVVILIVVLLAGSFIVLIDDIIKVLEDVVSITGESVATSYNTTLSWLGVSTVKDSLPRFIIKNESIEELKNQLNEKKLDTKTNGMTDVLLRKMLLTHAATTSIKDTLCMAETTTEDIIEDFKKKNPTYEKQDLNIDDVKKLCESLYKKENSNDVWKMEGNPGYNLYYNSSHFFFFKDTNNKFGDDSEKWFLAIMGCIDITTEDGQAFQYRTPEEFAKVKENWENALVNQGGDSDIWNYAVKLTDHESSYEALKKSYTRDSASSNKIKVYDITCKEDSYYYSFKNSNSKQTIDIEIPKNRDSKTGEERYTFGRIGNGCTYEANEREINLSEEIDLSQNSIPIELMMDYLDLTGSNEFLETFLDYAIESCSVSATAYSLEDEEIQYNKTTYNVANDFVIEAYDMYDYGTQSGEIPKFEDIWNAISKGTQSAIEQIQETRSVDFAQNIRDFIEQLKNSDKTSIALDLDINDDNFKAYYDIIFNREYNGGALPESKVTSIPDYKNIDYGGGNPFVVDKLHSYLKTAYDPAGDFDLGNISVTEVIRHRELTNQWKLTLNTVETWYKEAKYKEPNIRTLYQSDRENIASYEEYKNCDESKMSDYISAEDEQIERKYIYDKLINQVEGENPGLIGEYEKRANNDILQDTINNVEIGVGNQSQFENRTINGLAEIAGNDGGEKDAGTGFLSGSDLVYVKYKKTDIKKYTMIKRKKEILEENNIEETTSNGATEKQIEEFLALLRNETGTIPNPLHSGVFTELNDDPSIVVKYKDIYGGTAPVGDLMLDNGALTMFELLKNHANTQTLENLFRYMAYRYSNTDYGVTDINSLVYIFNLNGSSTLYGNSIEEKIWFALREAGISEIAAAAVMGNLYAEGVFKSNNLEDSYERVIGMSDEEYTSAVNSGEYKNFANDGYGYGLAGWTYSSRKKGLYEYTKSKGVGVDDEQAQIEFLITEITDSGPASGYATCQMNLPNKGYTKKDWENATSVEEATAAFCYVFERPGIPHLEKRQIMAKQYYNTYKGRATPSMGNYTGTEGEKLCQAAQKILEHTTNYNYTYNTEVPDYSEGVRSLWNKRGVCCASYVAWVLVESGVVSEDFINTLYFRGATSLGNGLKKIFPTVSVSSMADLQKGDIVVWPGHHIQMYAGDGYWYNGGASTIPPVKHSKYDALSYFSYYGSYYVLRPVQQ